MVQRLSTSEAEIETAASIIKSGGLVSFPTETVYGLGADASNDTALARLYEAKGRPSFNPLIVHAPSVEALETQVEFSDTAKRLAYRFWPGALTLVLPRSKTSQLSLLVSAGLETAAVRVPHHPVAQALLARSGRLIAAPSANASGRLSPTKAQHVYDDIGEKIDAIIDGGACSVGVESTILDLSSPVPILLRPGGLAVSEIEETLDRKVEAPNSTKAAEESRPAPGMLSSHYAPRARLRLNAQGPLADEAMLAFGSAPDATLNLSPSGNLVEAAANLFSMLHELDALNVAAIAVSPIPETGLGLAINDRLHRAAAPRP